MYYRARFYDPNLGRFISEDPIGFGGGDINLYGYVWNSPGSFTDPMGLDGWGSDVADWTDARIDVARRAFQGDVQNWQWNGTVNTVADLVSLAVDPLRTGKGVGDAIYAPNLTPFERGVGVVTDLARAAAIAAPVASIFAKLRALFPPVRAPGSAIKACPNPYGKLGSPEHQAGVRQVAADIKARGLRPQTEYQIYTPNGAKSKRFADVVGLDGNDIPVEIHQVGRQTKGGLPVSRERQAINDIRNATGINPGFHPF